MFLYELKRVLYDELKRESIISFDIDTFLSLVVAVRIRGLCKGVLFP